MYSKIIIEGNAVYEIDEECLKRKKEKEQAERKSTDPEAGKKQGAPLTRNG